MNDVKAVTYDELDEALENTTLGDDERDDLSGILSELSLDVPHFVVLMDDADEDYVILTVKIPK